MKAFLPFTFLCVLSAHILGALLFVQTQQMKFGASIKETAAISMNLAETLVVEEKLQEKQKDKTASDQSVDQKQGNPEESAEKKAPQKIDEKEKPSEKNEKQEIKKVSPGLKETNKTVKPLRPKKNPKKEINKNNKTKNFKKSHKGGASARSKENQKRKAGRVSASAGQVRSYQAKVRAWLARHKPNNIRAEGTVVISFSIDTNGRLRNVRLVRTSQSAYLDRVALTVVRKASPFPKPPKGMTLSQLKWTVPFYFK